MAKDLRTFLDEYEKLFPEDVVRIKKPLSVIHECSAIVKHFEDLGKYPIIIFEKVITSKGKESAFPCITNILGTRKKLAHAIGSNFEEVGIDWARRAAEQKLDPVVVDAKDAPCKENIILGDEIDLFDLPALKHHSMDPGPYITAGNLTCYHPDSWIDNCAFHRGFIAGPRELRSYLTPFTHAANNLREHEAQDKEMKVAYWIGHHPAFIMGGQTRMSWPESHYQAAGGVAGEPLRLVSSQSLGKDFLVPADAEFIIEGIMRPGRRELEGPFGEYTRYFGPQLLSPVFEVTAVTHRNNPLWHSFMVGINNNYAGTFTESTVYAAVKKAVPQVQRVYLPLSGCGRHHVYIQIRKTAEGQPRDAIMAALSCCEWVKHVIVVDEDIDIYDERWVMWAVATRSQWDKDLIVVPGCRGSKLDPSVETYTTTKGGIDATKPAPPARFSAKVAIPEEVLDKIRLPDFVAADDIGRVPDLNQR